jgi:hypothetical protein
MNCVECENNLVFYLYGELPAEAEESMEQHLNECAGCHANETRLAKVHRAIEVERLEPSLELLSACRQDLADSLRSVTQQSDSGWRRWLGPFGMPGWSWRLAGCAALVAVGFLAARVLPGPGASGFESGQPVVSSVSHVEKMGDGSVRIVLQDSVARELSGRLDDQAVQSLLLTAARNTVDPAVRVDALDLLRGGISSPEVRDTLLEALRKDPNDGVRMKALESLRPLAGEPNVRAVLLDALREDRNAMVRANAVDVLTMGNAQNSELAGALQELMQREENLDVRRQGQRVLRSMNASLETF